jgi:hypothetical protein
VRVQGETPQSKKDSPGLLDQKFFFQHVYPTLGRTSKGEIRIETILLTWSLFLTQAIEIMELARGIEPPTCGLQNRCSAIELRQRSLIFSAR